MDGCLAWINRHGGQSDVSGISPNLTYKWKRIINYLSNHFSSLLTFIDHLDVSDAGKNSGHEKISVDCKILGSFPASRVPVVTVVPVAIRSKLVRHITSCLHYHISQITGGSTLYHLSQTS